MNSLFPAPPDLFEEFWAAYPRKVAKGAARKAYAKALGKARHDDIMYGLSQQIPEMRAKEPRFVPHASTWLTAERWEDETEQPSDVQAVSKSDARARERYVAARAIRSPGADIF